MSLQQELTDRILNIPDVELKKSRFSAKEAFFIGTREIAHFHSEAEIDIRLTRPLIRKLGLMESPDKRIHIRTPSTDWVEFCFLKEFDLEDAVELLERAARANKTSRA